MKGYRKLFLGILSIGLLPYAALYAQPYQDPLDAPVELNRLATTSQLTSVTTAGQRLVAVGARGMVLLSDDQGKDWQQAKVPVSSDLVAVQFVTDQQGWAVGHDGVVLHSADAGSSWEKQLDGNSLEKLLVDHFQTLANQGDDKAAQYLDLIKLNFANGPEQPMLGVWFRDPLNGFAVGAFGTIVATHDGGKTWESWMEKVDNPEMFHYNSITGVNGRPYIASEQGSVFKLAEGQQHFIKLTTGYTGSFFGVLGNEHYLLAYGLRGNAYKSSDQGKTWERLVTSNSAGLVDGAVDDKGRILLASEAGAVIVSGDQGKSFSVLPDVHPALFAGLTLIKGQVAIVGLSGVQVVRNR
ncbi:YCF48-related protein [Pseudomonas sp. GB2N2]